MLSAVWRQYQWVELVVPVGLEVLVLGAAPWGLSPSEVVLALLWGPPSEVVRLGDVL